MAPLYSCHRHYPPIIHDHLCNEMVISPTLPPFNPFTNSSYKNSSRRHLKRERYINYSDWTRICRPCTVDRVLYVEESGTLQTLNIGRRSLQVRKGTSRTSKKVSQYSAKNQPRISTNSFKN